MVFFITFLRAIAACLITNAHYSNIYPISSIASGGLIGDVLFFAVSGYCLYNVKQSFPRWYGKRLWRVFLPVIIGTAVILLIGGYDFSAMPWYRWFIYPTYYHFVASIIVLYIPFYFIARSKLLREHIPHIMIGIAVLMLIIYFVWYDKSYYHIDNVREPFIRLLFMECMLLGAYFKRNTERYHNSFSWHIIPLLLISIIAYFVTKIVFSRVASLVWFQILNQTSIFILLYFVFRLFCGIDHILEKLPKPISKIISYIADITLEIYIVQYAIIAALESIFVFPLNWLVVTASIVIAASILHIVCKLIYKAVDVTISKTKLALKKRG